MSSFLPNRTVSVYDFEINDCYYDVDGAEAVGNVDHFSSFEPKQENREKMEEFSPIKSRTFDNSVASVEDRWPDGMREILSDSHFKALHSSMYNHMAIMNQRLFRPEWLASLWYPTNARKQNQSPDECFGFAKSERVDLFEAWLKFKNFQKRIAEVPRANEALVSAMLQHFLAEAMGYGPPDSSSGKCFIHHELSVRQEKRNFRKQRLRQEPMSDLLDFFLFNASQIGEEKLTGKSGKTEKVVQFYVGKQWIEEDVAVLHLGRPIEKPLAGNKRLKREDDDEDFHMKKDPRMK